jgi:hypothetical protein
VSIVLADSWSWAAIWLLDAPSATRCKISRSRALSSASGSLAVPLGCASCSGSDAVIARPR